MIFVSKYIYGLDPSIACTGVAIVELKTKNLMYVSHISTNPKDDYGVRLNKIRNHIEKLFKEYPPYEVAIERSFTRFNTATQVLYRCHGVINELFHKYPQFYYPPKTVKVSITNDGSAKKELLQKYIFKQYPNVEFKNFDESDAVGIALCHLIKKHKHTL